MTKGRETDSREKAEISANSQKAQETTEKKRQSGLITGSGRKWIFHLPSLVGLSCTAIAPPEFRIGISLEGSDRKIRNRRRGKNNKVEETPESQEGLYCDQVALGSRRWRYITPWESVFIGKRTRPAPSNFLRCHLRAFRGVMPIAGVLTRTQNPPEWTSPYAHILTRRNPSGKPPFGRAVREMESPQMQWQ